MRKAVSESISGVNAGGLTRRAYALWIGFLVGGSALLAAWLLFNHPACPGPVTGAQALPWLEQTRAAYATACAGEAR